MKLFTSAAYFAVACITGILLTFEAFAVKHVVQVSEFQFSPNTLTGLMVGDTLRWEWQNGSHTTTSSSIPTGAASWDAPLDGSNTSFEYPVLVAGTYLYSCVPHSGMGMTGAFTAFEFSTSAGESGLQSQRVQFYPNPIGNTVKIALHSDETVPGILRVYNLKGEIVMQIPFGIRTGENLFDLPIAILGKGMYLFEVTAGDRRMGMQRLAKN